MNMDKNNFGLFTCKIINIASYVGGGEESNWFNCEIMVPVREPYRLQSLIAFPAKASSTNNSPSHPRLLRL